MKIQCMACVAFVASILMASTANAGALRVEPRTQANTTVVKSTDTGGHHKHHKHRRHHKGQKAARPAA
jgi:hypothetical protein